MRRGPAPHAQGLCSATCYAGSLRQADEAETAYGMVVARRSGVICAAVGCGRIGVVPDSAATHDMKMLDASDRILWIRDGKVDRLERRDQIDIKVGHIDGQGV